MGTLPDTGGKLLRALLNKPSHGAEKILLCEKKMQSSVIYGWKVRGNNYKEYKLKLVTDCTGRIIFFLGISFLDCVDCLLDILQMFGVGQRLAVTLKLAGNETILVTAASSVVYL